MKRLDSAKKFAPTGESRIVHPVLFWPVFVWFVLISVPVYAEADSSLTMNEMSEAIEITAHDASLDVFIQALFSNVDIDVEIDGSVEGVVNGTYDGSISEVFSRLKREFSLVSRTEDRLVKVLSQSMFLKSEKNKISRSTRGLAKLSTLEMQSEQGLLHGNSQSDQIRYVKEPRKDEVIERVFVLKNAIAVDTRPKNTNYPVIPGVVTRLSQLIEKLGVSSFTYVDAPISRVTEHSHSITALPSMNAIIVKDLASRMALYEDLIDSLDVESTAISSNSSDHIPQKSPSKWKAVR